MQDINYHINDQATSSTDLEDAITLSCEGLDKLRNILWVVTSNEERSDSELSILARTGGDLSDDYIELSRSFQDDLLKNRPILNFSKNTSKKDKINFIENKLDEINIAMDSVNKIGAICRAIKSITEKHTQPHKLADIGVYIADDYENMIDCMREEIEIKCGFKVLPQVA